MKKAFIPISLVLAVCCAVVSLSSCGGDDTPTTLPYTYKYNTTLTAVDVSELLSGDTDAATTATEADLTTAVVTETVIVTYTIPATAVEVPVTAPPDQEPFTTAPDGSLPTTETTTLPAVTTTAPPETTTRALSDVKLSLTLPKANGEMRLSSAASNKYIAAVSAQRAIPAERLACVYSVPESGQNYVLEFGEQLGTNGEILKTASNLSRVFLLDGDCYILYVAASDQSMCENVSPVENWFCMDVIIKQMIMPEIEDKL